MAVSFELFNLEGRLALITGSSQGIGFVLARGLAEHGAAVIANGRDRARVDAALTALENEGHTVYASVFDVTDAEDVRAAIDAVEEEIGPLDILVNNAGMQYRAPLEDFPVDKWRRLLETNISSGFYAGQAVARHMIGRGRGKIVNIASVQSELARPSIAPYTATKGAIRNLTRGMATDWARHGLQVNAIAPGYFKTPLNQALVDNPEFTAPNSRPRIHGPEFTAMSRTAHAGGALGRCGRTGGRRCFSGQRRVELRQRAGAVCRWRHDGECMRIAMLRMIVMGVSGSGKSTVGEKLAEALKVPFLEGDSLHPQANVDKMASGIPLQDEDRWPWLDQIGERLAAAGDGIVISCSALRKAYRDRLRNAAGGPLAFVFLDGSFEVLHAHMGHRTGHFMPVTMLESQIATLESPVGEPLVFRADVADPAEKIVAESLAWVKSLK